MNEYWIEVFTSTRRENMRTYMVYRSKPKVAATTLRVIGPVRADTEDEALAVTLETTAKELELAHKRIKELELANGYR